MWSTIYRQLLYVCGHYMSALVTHNIIMVLLITGGKAGQFTRWQQSLNNSEQNQFPVCGEGEGRSHTIKNRSYTWFQSTSGKKDKPVYFCFLHLLYLSLRSCPLGWVYYQLETLRTKIQSSCLSRRPVMTRRSFHVQRQNMLMLHHGQGQHTERNSHSHLLSNERHQLT